MKPRFFIVAAALATVLTLHLLPDLAASRLKTKIVFFPSYVKTANHLVGTASWYGRPFHGRLTANGERYNMFRLSAAHKSLPLGSYLEVRNLENGKSIIVKVNDRGPYIGGRILDLSYAAAKKLGFVHRGLARIEARVLKKAETRLAQIVNK